MTDGQLKFQTLMETQRHNYEMESLGRSELATKQEQAKASSSQAAAALMNAETNVARQKLEENKHGWDIGWHFASFLFPDANTALKSGAQVVSALFG